MRTKQWFLAGIAGIGVMAASFGVIGAPAKGDKAPEWSLDDILQADNIKAKDVKWDHEAFKGKAVVLDFWGTW